MESREPHRCESRRSDRSTAPPMPLDFQVPKIAVRRKPSGTYTVELAKHRTACAVPLNRVPWSYPRRVASPKATKNLASNAVDRRLSQRARGLLRHRVHPSWHEIKTQVGLPSTIPDLILNEVSRASWRHGGKIGDRFTSAVFLCAFALKRFNAKTTSPAEPPPLGLAPVVPAHLRYETAPNFG
jgi:hypothetical protein